MNSAARLNLVLLVFVFAGATVFLGGWGLVWFSRSSYLSAVIALGLAIYCSGFAFQLAYVLWGGPHPRTEYGPKGTVIRPQKYVGRVFIACFGSGVCAAALYLVLSPFGMLEYTPTGVLRVGVPAFCGFMIVFGAPAIYRAVKYGAESHLRLSTKGFEVWNGHWGAFVEGKWDDIEQILDHPLRGRSIRREVMVLALSEGRSAMLVTDTMTGNGGALREWVQFYWQHPEYRDELVDHRGLQRLDENRFNAE